MVDDGGNPCASISSRTSAAKTYHASIFSSGMSGLPYKFVRVLDFHGFHSLFFGSWTHLEDGNRNPPGLRLYFLDFFPVKCRPDFFSISLNLA